MKVTSSTTSIADVPFNAPAAFDFQPLNRVVFGAGMLARLGELARELGAARALLVTDPGLEAAGHPQRAELILHDAGLAVDVFDGVEENPTSKHVGRGVEAARTHRADVLIAVGGGSAMDVCKGINFIYTNGGTMADYRGIGKATKPMLPSIGVPTTAGTGSEAQSYALIADEVSHLKMACGDRKAAFRIALLDPELTASQPPRVTAVTGIDALAHALESHVCVRANAVSQLFSAEAWRLLSAHYEGVVKCPTDAVARSCMQLGAYLAGAAIEASMLGCAHACANPLTAHYGTTHGMAVGVMLPHVIRFNMSAAAASYAELNGSSDLPETVFQYLGAADLPRSLRDLGVSHDILPLLAEEAAQQWTAKFNPRPASEADLLHLYEAAW